MAKTMQNVVDRARQPLNDAGKTRYTDAVLLGFANDAVLILRARRPDLFFGGFTSLPGDKALGENLPVDDELFVPICDYVTARAESGDDEYVVAERAAGFYALFKDGAGV